MYTELKPPSIVKGLIDTYNKKGFLALFRGNTVAIALSFLEQGIRHISIEYTRKYLSDEKGNVKDYHFLIIGGFTGIVSPIIMFPVEVVRVNVIAHGYNYQKHRVRKIFHNIYEKQGVRGFYSGIIPHWMAVIPMGGLNVTGYNVQRRIFVKKKENPAFYKAMIMGGLAGLNTCTITYPLSLITSRVILSQKSMRTVFNETLAGEGYMGFYKGYAAGALKLIIGNAFFFSSYEKCKLFFNIHQPKHDD
jgi:hypothetical protein